MLSTLGNRLNRKKVKIFMKKNLCKEKNYVKLEQCVLYLLDMDGTLYLGDDVFEGAIDFIKTLEKLGLDYIYLTNNSSRAGTDYIERLRRLGFPCEERNVYTSGMATAEYLRHNFDDRSVYVVGTGAFYNELKNAGIKVFNSEEYDRNAHPEINPVVCVGFDTELVYRDLDLAVHFLRKGSPFIAANPDYVCPMPEDEVLPDCGSICALLTASSGREPIYIGKPNRNMVDIISKMRGIPNDKICCVGDRLYTDIAVAQNAGAVSVCVLSGESSEQMISEMKQLPDYTMQDVAELGNRLLALLK